MGRVRISLVALALALGCASDSVSKGDAQKLLAGLEEAKLAAPADQPALLAKACADVASCAKSCANGLSAYAAATPDARVAALVTGCSDAKGHVDGKEGPKAAKAAANFIVDRVSKYVAKAADALDGDDKKKLTEARVALKL